MRVFYRFFTSKIGLFSLFLLAVIGFSIPVYSYLSQKKLPEVSQVTDDEIVSGAACSLPLQPKILQIEYYPKNVSNPTILDKNETGLDVTVADQERYVSGLSSELLELVGEATKFHGYKDASAPQFLQYSVLNNKKYYEKIPRGYLLKPNEGIYRPNYAQIMRNENICDYVDNKGVTEVWMFGYHHGAIEPDESRMASRLGDFSNSWPKEELLPDQFKLPICDKPYVLYNFNYTRSVLEMFHNRIHQLENILPRAEGKYPPTPENTKRGASMFWGNFSEYVQPYTVRNYNSSCGNAHYAPNWTSLSDDYKYNLQNSSLNNCETWNPDASKSAYIKADCSQWGCTEKGFYMWYQQNLPGYNNGITFNRIKVNNWWEALYDPVAYLEKGGLTGESIYNKCSVGGVLSTPTPILTITQSVTPPVTHPLSPTSIKTSTPSPTPPVSVCDPYADGESKGKLNVQDLVAVRREVAGLDKTNRGRCLTSPPHDKTNLPDLLRLRRILVGLEEEHESVEN